MTTFTAGPKDGQSADWGLDAFGDQLAMLLSPAVRIEPELLRSVRLECLAHVDVGVEQDLWFSPLVSARSDAGITFAVETTLQLRQQLRSWYADDPATVEQARQVMARVHRGLSPLLLVEEQLAWAAVTGDRSAAERIAGLLVRAVSAGRPDIDHWLARVWRMMPPAARDGADGWVLGQVAAARGAPVDAGPAPQWLDADQLRALLAGVADVPLNVAGTASLGYRLGVPVEDAEVSIAVPDTAPRLLEIRGGAQSGTRRVELAPGSVLDVPPGPRPVEIRTARGAVYVLDGQVGTLADAVVVDLRGPSCSVPLPDGWIVIGTGDPDRVASLLPVGAGPALDLLSVVGGDPQQYGVGTFVARGELPGKPAFAYGGLVPGRPVRTLAFDDSGLPHVHTVRTPPAPEGPALLDTDGRRLLPGAPVVNDDGSLAGIVTVGGWIDDPPAALPAEMLRETLRRLQTVRSAGAHVLVVLPRSTDDEGPNVLPNKLRLPQAMADSLRPQGTLWVAARRGPRNAEWFELVGRIVHSTPTRTLPWRWEVEVGSSSDLTRWPVSGLASALLESVIGRIDGQDSQAHWTVLSIEAAAALDECADRFPPGAATPGTTAVSIGPALRVGDMVVCPLMDGPKPHVGGPITPAASVPTVLIGGLPAAVANVIPGGIVCVSPAPNGIIMGSMTVLVGGFPAARLGDLSMHGTPIVPGPGCPTVLIGG